MIVDDAPALQAAMSRLLAAPLHAGDAISHDASPALIAGVAGFLDTVARRH